MNGEFPTTFSPAGVPPPAPLSLPHLADATITPKPTGEANADFGAEVARRHLRGSGLLFLGRLTSKWLNFAVQVLVVRFLSEADYGALAYAMAIVAVLQQVATFGLHQSVPRFVPLFQEQQRYDKLFGTMLISFATVFLLGLALVATIHAGQNLLGDLVVRDERALAVLLLLVFLVPLQGLDNLLLAMFAVLASPGAIFLRRHVLAPGLKLVVLLVVMLAGYGVLVVAAGYLVVEAIGLLIGVAMFRHFVRQSGLNQHLRWRGLTLPWREVFTFTVPLLCADLLYLSFTAINVILLEWFNPVSEVAFYRAMVPLALLIDIVRSSFTPLFMPSVSRMLARNDRQGIHHLYWQTAIWVTVLAYPVFALLFSAATPITVLLYGDRYASASAILSLLALGLYFDILLGLNSLLLKVYGLWRCVFLVNAGTLVVGTLAGVLLIPRYGALGAGITTCLTWIVHALFNQYALSRQTGVRMFESRYLAIYVRIAVATAGVELVIWAFAPPTWVVLALPLIAALLVLRWNSRVLRATEVFPELTKVPLLNRLLD